MPLERFMQERLEERQRNGNLRALKNPAALVDFTSNDYLGLARSGYCVHTSLPKGSTGSRLLTGQSEVVDLLEERIARCHNSSAALIFNSGYTANLGLIDALMNEKGFVLYDLHCHASIQDGIRFSRAQGFPFFHNDVEHLKKRLEAIQSKNLEKAPVCVYVESVYSMDGSMAPLSGFAQLCENYGAALIVDEAHAVGIFGEKGRGCVSHECLDDKVFARILPYGKAFGAFGAAVLGSKKLKDYLINFSRPFCYSTALPPHAIQAISEAYDEIEKCDDKREYLLDLITYFRALAEEHGLPVIHSKSPIQSILVSGNERVKAASVMLANEGFDVRPILSPTVRQGREILRLILHTFNSFQEVDALVRALKRIL